MIIDRRKLLVGGLASIILSACSDTGSVFSPKPAAMTPSAPSLLLYKQMRSAGVFSIVGTDGKATVLPEFQGKIAPYTSVPTSLDDCHQIPLAAPRHVTSDCMGDGNDNSSLPVIATITCYAGSSVAFGAVSGDFYDFRAGYTGGLLGGLHYGPIYTSKPPGLQHGAFQCVGEELTAIGSALSLIAANIKNAPNAVNLYGPNLVRAAGWLLTSTITASEFATLFMAFCGPAELLGLVATVLVTVGAIVEYVKCLHGG